MTDEERANGRSLRTLLVATLASGFLWLASPAVTGRTEPWDAEGFFYPVGLAVAGIVAGGIAPRPLWAQFLGSLIGPLAYQALFLEIGPLFLLGAILSLGYSIVFTAAAAVGAVVRRIARGGANGTSTWRNPSSGG